MERKPSKEYYEELKKKEKILRERLAMQSKSLVGLVRSGELRPPQKISTCQLCLRHFEADSKPLPVKRCKIDGVEQDAKDWTVKQWLQKINEELDELKDAIVTPVGLERKLGRNTFADEDVKNIAEEAMDTITAITSMLEAIGIDAEKRDEAQRLVNEKNRKRGRL